MQNENKPIDKETLIQESILNSKDYEDFIAMCVTEFSKGFGGASKVLKQVEQLWDKHEKKIDSKLN